ncbi:hypothetical protein AB4037_34545 [Labrys sp. KB_33_2]
MPADIRLYRDGLYKTNQEAFKRGEELGWMAMQQLLRLNRNCSQ